jgi:hypothetical protein
LVFVLGSRCSRRSSLALASWAVLWIDRSPERRPDAGPDLLSSLTHPSELHAPAAAPRLPQLLNASPSAIAARW